MAPGPARCPAPALPCTLPVGPGNETQAWMSLFLWRLRTRYCDLWALAGEGMLMESSAITYSNLGRKQYLFCFNFHQTLIR